jgi:hypothetical protein
MIQSASGDENPRVRGAEALGETRHGDGEAAGRPPSAIGDWSTASNSLRKAEMRALCEWPR